jgi:hypothetical protein
MEAVMNAIRHLCLAPLLVAAISVAAAAQPSPNIPYSGGNTCTTLNGFGGAAWADSDPGGMFGGALGWEFTPWFGIEGSASWFDRPGNEGGFSASFDGHLKLPASEAVVPFLKGGFGLYRASFEGDGEEMPMFYRHRLHATGTGVEQSQAFTDPAFVLGGGISLFLSRHLSLRPDVTAILAVRDSDTRVITTVTLHVAYHFEDHPITPSRLGR